MTLGRKYPVEFSSKVNGRTPRLYKTWSSMIRRCGSDASPNDARKYYDRGIRVCDEWKDWPTFARWAREHGYRDDLTIDRVDSGKDYCPENCRWLTLADNLKNRDAGAMRKSALKRWERAFLCIETGEVFFNAQAFVKAKGVSIGSVYNALRGLAEPKRFHLVYIEAAGARP